MASSENIDGEPSNQDGDSNGDNDSDDDDNEVQVDEEPTNQDFDSDDDKDRVDVEIEDTGEEKESSSDEMPSINAPLDPNGVEMVWLNVNPYEDMDEDQMIFCNNCKRGINIREWFAHSEGVDYRRECAKEIYF